MAIDARIALAGQVPNVGQAINIFENALMNSQTRGLRQSQEARAAELAPLQLQQQQQGIDINQQTLAANQAAAEQQTENRILRSVSEFGTKLKPVLESGNTDQALNMLTTRFQELQGQGLPTNETVEAITAIRGGNAQQVLSGIDTVQQIAQQRGLTGRPQVSVGQRDFENLIDIAQSPTSTQLEKDSARRELGDLAKVGSLTSQERLGGDKALTSAVATSQAEIAGAKAGATEGEKLKKQLKHKPAITKAVKLAEKEATERGEVLTDLARMEASLPGIKEVFNELVELSSIATSTLGGRAFDFAMKESGFGSTKGADARAKLVAIVDNQVLPLLKETFGAAFTVQEGDNLKASLVDPNASPSQKREQLDAFIAQKERNVRTKQAQLGIQPDANNVDVPSVDISTMSIEDLIAERERLGGQ